MSAPGPVPAEQRGSPTAEIAARVCAAGFDALDDEAVSAVKLLIADGIAVAVAGSVETAPRLVAEHVRELGCGGKASVWGHRFRTAPVHAAYANAAARHVLDFEPMSSPPTHAVSPTLPVALALAEALQANGREIVAACAKGFEMQGRVLLASSHDRGALPFHTPGVVGVMGAAVAASHLLELDPARLCHALGMAIKFYPSKYPTHFGIAAALGLRDRIGDPRDIARVSIDSPDIADADRPRPRSGLEGKFSFQYTVAAALLDGGVGMESFTDDRRFREDMARLLERIELVRDPGRSRDTRNMSVAVSVILRDGSTHRNVCSRPPGSWGEPIDVESHRAKVSSCLRVRLSAADAERLMDLLARLEALSGPEALQLPALLS